MTPIRLAQILVVWLALGAMPASATDIVIHTGGAPTGEGSSYHTGIGAGLEQALTPIARTFGYTVRRVPSSGALANAQACAEEETHICFGIGKGGLDYPQVALGEIQVVRQDLPGECALAFTREARLPNWKSIVDNAERVTFVVPDGSGEEALIRRIFASEPALAGTEPRFEHASAAPEILRKVRAIRGAVGVSYTYPNPIDGLVGKAAEEGMTVLGILSPTVARSDSAFYLNRKVPYQLSWYGLGTTRTVRAMCAKGLLFAGQPDRLSDEWAQGDAREIIAQVAALPASAFVPEGGPLSRLMLSVEGLSEEYGVNQMVEDLEDQVTERLP